MQRCESGKVRHTSPARAKVAAHAFARALNAEGKIANTLYAYRCPKCRGGWHITRQAGWPGMVQVFDAPSEELQRWAMPTHVHRCPLGHPHPIVQCRCVECGEWFDQP